MNKEYIYNGGYVTVIDENGNARPIVYSDNLEKILIQENVIETIENKMAKLEDELGIRALIQDINEKGYKPFVLPMFVGGAVFSPVLSYFLGNTDIFTTQVSTIFGTMSEALSYAIPFSIAFIPMGIALENSLYSQYKHLIKREFGLKSELEFLRQKLITEKDNLSKINIEKSRENENTEFRIVQIDDSEELSTLDGWLNFCFILGYDSKKYYRYYGEGKLEEILTKEGYTESACEYAKKYMEENGPTLVKRSKHR